MLVKPVLCIFTVPAYTVCASTSSSANTRMLQEGQMTSGKICVVSQCFVVENENMVVYRLCATLAML